MGGNDRWLQLARFRLNTCVYTCNFFFSRMEVMRGSLTDRGQVASLSPRLGREVGEKPSEFVFFPILNRR